MTVIEYQSTQKNVERNIRTERKLKATPRMPRGCPLSLIRASIENKQRAQTTTPKRRMKKKEERDQKSLKKKKKCKEPTADQVGLSSLEFVEMKSELQISNSTHDHLLGEHLQGHRLWIDHCPTFFFLIIDSNLTHSASSNFHPQAPFLRECWFLNSITKVTHPSITTLITGQCFFFLFLWFLFVSGLLVSKCAD